LPRATRAFFTASCALAMFFFNSFTACCICVFWSPRRAGV
jgi:hypothetical protein